MKITIFFFFKERVFIKGLPAFAKDIKNQG